MAASGTRRWVVFRQSHVDPVVGINVVDASLVRPRSLPEPTEDNHLTGVGVDHRGVLVPVYDRLLQLLLLPHKVPQVQIAQAAHILKLILVSKLLRLEVVAAENIHVVLVNYRRVVGDPIWNSSWVARRLDATPATAFSAYVVINV